VKSREFLRAEKATNACQRRAEIPPEYGERAVRCGVCPQAAQRPFDRPASLKIRRTSGMACRWRWWTIHGAFCLMLRISSSLGGEYSRRPCPGRRRAMARPDRGPHLRRRPRLLSPRRSAARGIRDSIRSSLEGGTGVRPRAGKSITAARPAAVTLAGEGRTEVVSGRMLKLSVSGRMPELPDA